jgi:AraC family transcriptional regulator of adaptative response/methylated-DNA-[protein]-cysteine methyltransferase
MDTRLAPAEMERAFFAGDAGYDGLFVVAVRTTGIFCRPSCPARKPLAKNVEYFTALRDAVFAGYRPCKRCQPLTALGVPPEWVDPLLKEVEADPDRRWMAKDLRQRGLTPERVRRWFQGTYGMTFTAWCRARRLGQAFTRLREGARIDDVVFDHGFESHSGFREAFTQAFGLPPGKAAGGDCLHSTLFQTPLGPMVAAATSRAVCFLEFADRRMFQEQVKTLARRFRLPLVPEENRLLAQLRTELQAYFDGRLRTFTVPLLEPGTPFQERVWNELRRIPFGETISYDVLADRAGSPGAQRAAGTANGMNRLAILVPCHRVVGKDGQLAGYGGGLWRKRLLLELERTGRLETGTLGATSAPIP